MVSLQPCHLINPADCQALVNFSAHSFGRIDVLFNNAAMAYFNWLEDITDEEWSRDLREELDLVFFLAHTTAKAGTNRGRWRNEGLVRW
jgi:NAD(P)-dependent dehydrogenase (short-subunit alcohol dehydrogenase family)